MLKNRIQLSMALLALTALVGCAAPKPKDYSAFRSADPKTILILPPKNSSPDVKATYGVYSQTPRPVAEAGFYVLPITLVDEHFKAQGMTVADDIHAIDVGKLREVFGADAALYIDVKEYGSKYYVIGSATVVTTEGRLVNLRTGDELWKGVARASSDEQSQNSGGIAGLLITALVKQVMAAALDQSYPIAGMTTQRLLDVQSPGALIPGPRHPAYPKR